MKIGTKLIKPSLKFRIVFAIGTAVMYAFILWLFDSFSEEELYSIKNLLFQGVFFGVFFGIGFPYINEKLAVKFSNKVGIKIKPELGAEEKIEIEGPANLFRGMEGVGGKIFLTDKKLIFKSHKINIQKGQTNIEYKNIKDVIKRKTAKIIDNGIRIITNDNKEFDFVVNERDLWFEKINERINKKTLPNTMYN
ncbi:MAG: GRAM domain-containing protein [Flavobacteriaceae bacterium]